MSATVALPDARSVRARRHHVAAGAIGDTALDKFDDIETEVVNGLTTGKQQTLYPGPVMQADYQVEITKKDSPIARTTAEDGIEIQFDIVAPQGVVDSLPKSGKKKRQELTGTASLRDFITRAVVATIPYPLPNAEWTAAAPAGGLTTASDTVLIAASATQRNFLTSIDIAHASQATEVVVKDGATLIWRRMVNPGQANAFHFASPLKSTLNQTLGVACVTAGAAVYVNAQGYQALR